MKKQQILKKIEELQKKLADGDYTDDSNDKERTAQGKVAIRRNDINKRYGIHRSGVSSLLCDISNIIMHRSKDYKAITNLEWDEVRANSKKPTTRLRTYCNILKNEELYFAIYEDVCRAFAEIIEKYR